MLYPIKPIEPSPSHHFLSLLERKKILLRVYTQNIDGLEEKAGVSSKKIVYAHGSMNTSSCLKCGQKVSADELRQEILSGNVPYCKRILNKNRKRKRKEVERVTQMNHDDRCTKNSVNGGSNSNSEMSMPVLVKTRQNRSSSNNLTESSQPCNVEDDINVQLRTCDGVMKPNITFFGEQLVDRVKKCLEADRKKADAVIVIGTSLSVAPMSKIIEYLSPSIPRILINQTIVIPKHGTYCGDGKRKDTDNNINGDSDKDHRDNFVFDACLLGFCDEVTTSLTDIINHKNSQMSKKAPMLQGPNDFDVLCNLSRLKEVLNEQSLFRHPHDRIFLYPGAIINKNDDNIDDNDESTENVFEEIVHCDGCHEVIKDVVMKCTDCFDFDLCQDCYANERVSKVHFSGHHKFVAEDI